MLCLDRSSTRRLCRVGWMGPRATARRSGRLTTQLYPISDFWVSATPPPPTASVLEVGKVGFPSGVGSKKGKHERTAGERWAAIATPPPYGFPTFASCGPLTEVRRGPSTKHNTGH